MRDALVEITEWANGGIAARLFRCRVDNVDVEIPGALTFRPLALDLSALPPLDTVANVEAYGARIHSELSSHPAIRDELTQLFQTPARAFLKFFINLPAGERYRWEALCQSLPPKFLALRDVCTVTRLASMNDHVQNVRTFDGLIRMAAFLSPANISPKDKTDELDSIKRQVTAARTAGLNIECTIYLGDQELLDKLVTDIAAGTVAGIKAAPIPSNTEAIDQLLREQPVHILHFFCHGIVTAGVQALELATINDVDISKDVGSLVLSLERLNKILTITGTTWVTVLNSCSGAMAVGQLHSMARMLTRDGSPFTVGMAEPIPGVDASIFSSAFYGRLFGVMQASLKGAAEGSVVLLDCATAVIDARRRVHNTYAVNPPDAFGRWTLPLLYERTSPLVIKVVPAVTVDEAMKLRIATVAGALRSLPATAPPQMREDILALLDKDPKVPKELRPDALGAVSVT
jgi:hypothetical protein